jgi:hypothetical protein
MIGLGQALFARKFEEPTKGDQIPDQPRDSFVRPGGADFVFAGDWATEIAPRVDKVSRQWSERGRSLGSMGDTTRACNEARNNGDTIEVYKCAISPIIRLIPQGSRATLQTITAEINNMAGPENHFKPDIPCQDLSHLWTLNKARRTGTILKSQTVETLLALYGQQQEYEKATGISGKMPYGSSSKQFSSKV